MLCNLNLMQWFDYALESQCHVGKECIYDIYEKQKGMNEIFASVQYHSINYVINKVIDKYDVPKCILKPGCLATECSKWIFKE